MRAKAEIPVVASSRDQASILFRQAAEMVRRSGRVEYAPRSEGVKGYWIDGELYEVKAGYREIRLGDNRMKVLAADANTADGEIPTLALVDELHRQRSLELYEILADGLDAPAPAGRRGSLRDFERFCGLLILDDGQPMRLEAHERKIFRIYFAGYREIVVVLGKKNGKTTGLAALGLYHLKMGSPVRQMITISTAGSDEESPLGQLRKKAHSLPSFRRRAKVNTARTDDKSFAWVEWCLDPEDDRTDFELVKKVNPASWHTPDTLRRAYEKPSRTEGSWARLRCGVWTAGEESWLEAPEWDALRVDIGGVADGERVWAAVVYGQNPAVAVAAARPEDLMLVSDEEETVEVVGAAVRCWIYEGRPRYTLLEHELITLGRVYDLAGVLYDGGEFGRSAELLESQGLPMVESPHSPERLARATSTVQRIIQAGILRHDGDEGLRTQMLRSQIKESQRSRTLVKGDGSRGVIAVALAVQQATLVSEEPPRPLIVVAG